MKDNLKNISCVTFLVVIILIIGMIWTWRIFLSPEICKNPTTYKHYVICPDSITANLKITPDSVTLEKYLAYIDSVNQVVIRRADNYISDVDLMIAKSSAWVGVWIGIFAVVLTVPTVIQLVMAYRSDVKVEELIQDGKQDVALLENKLKCSITEHRISSIMMCLSSIPDPQLTPSQDEKRRFVDHYIQFLSEEFCKYITLVKESLENAKKAEKTGDAVERSNMLMVIMMIKTSLIRSQCVFSDITHNIHYHIVKNYLDKTYQEIERGELWDNAMISRLYEVRKQLDILIAALKVR